MGAKTGIEWTDSTWNPFIGCSRVSEGCRNCYAERLAGRFSAKTEGVYAGTTQAVNGLQVWTGKINRAPEETLLKPLHWRSPRRIFVNSMSDLFHESVPDEWIDQVFAVMALCPQHVFQVLTKRPERMLAYLQRFATGAEWASHLSELVDEDDIPLFGEDVECGIANTINGVLADGYNVGWPMKNVWLGVSVENQEAADERIPLLLQTPAAVRFISAEPLLGPVNLLNICPSRRREDRPVLYLNTLVYQECEPFARPGIDWVICGGESGPGARPMHPDWARSLRDQCIAAGVPFFFKQWGEWRPPLAGEEFNTAGGEAGRPAAFILENSGIVNCFHHPGEQGATPVIRVGKKAAGALLDGREWKQFPDELTTEN